jgi:pSer/pThr/pTyr-binding forkhead associated (FHA) protein
MDLMKLSLVVTQGKPEGKEIPIRLSQFLIGRDPECHLRPASPLVSKRHAALLIREGKVFLRDFGSTNGTYVNKQLIQGEVELKDGDELTIGPLGFRVKLSVAETPKPSALTQTDKALAAAVAQQSAPAKKPEPKPKKPQPQDEEESVMELLLNLEGEAGGGAGAEGDPIPGGSTIMQIKATGDKPEDTQQAGAEETQSPEKKKPEKHKQKIVDPQATAEAAKAILEKYMRRPRT